MAIEEMLAKKICFKRRFKSWQGRGWLNMFRYRVQKFRSSEGKRPLAMINKVSYVDFNQFNPYLLKRVWRNRNVSWNHSAFSWKWFDFILRLHGNWYSIIFFWQIDILLIFQLNQGISLIFLIIDRYLTKSTNRELWNTERFEVD